MTPDKLREKGNRWRELGQYDLADIYNQHAAAIEEIERLKRENSLMAAHQGIDNHQRLIDRAEQAERRAERLKGHAEAMYVGIKHDAKFCLLRPNEWAEKAADAYRADKGE